MDNKIVSCRLEPGFISRGRVAEYTIHGTTSDGVEHKLFAFYTDEKHYTAKSFVGMTITEAHTKFLIDDIAYLRS